MEKKSYKVDLHPSDNQMRHILNEILLMDKHAYDSLSIKKCLLFS